MPIWDRTRVGRCTHRVYPRILTRPLSAPFFPLWPDTFRHDSTMAIKTNLEREFSSPLYLSNGISSIFVLTCSSANRWNRPSQRIAFNEIVPTERINFKLDAILFSFTLEGTPRIFNVIDIIYSTHLRSLLGVIWRVHSLHHDRDNDHTNGWFDQNAHRQPKPHWPPAVIICIRTWRGTRSHIIRQVRWNWHRNRGDRSAEREKNKREKQEDEMV